MIGRRLSFTYKGAVSFFSGFPSRFSAMDYLLLKFNTQHKEMSVYNIVFVMQVEDFPAKVIQAFRMKSSQHSIVPNGFFKIPSSQQKNLTKIDL